MSHLASLGINVETNEELDKYLEKAYEAGNPVEASEGFYLHYRDASQAELWIQVNKEEELIGLNPHYAGKGDMKVGLMFALDEQEDAMDGGFFAWAAPSELNDEEEPGEFPFVFDLPDFLTIEEMELPVIRNVQLTGFPQQVDYFDSEDDFLAAQEEETRLEVKSVIPVGLFDEEGLEDDFTPEAFAIVNGFVLEAEEKTNTLTGENFVWVLLDTLGGTIDLVFPPEMLEDDEIVKGGVLSAFCWISGRLK